MNVLSILSCVELCDIGARAVAGADADAAAAQHR